MRIRSTTRRFHGVQISLAYMPHSQIPDETEGSWEAPQTETASIVGRSKRAELAAIAWIMCECRLKNITHQVVITTDSQYAINAIHNLQIPFDQATAHADLLLIMRDNWRPGQFVLRQIKSHQNILEATNSCQCRDIQGNSFADAAAVRARHTDAPDHHNAFGQIERWNRAQIHQTICVLKYLHDLNLAHMRIKKKSDKIMRQIRTRTPARIGERYTKQEPALRFLTQRFYPYLIFIHVCLQHACGERIMPN